MHAIDPMTSVPLEIEDVTVWLFPLRKRVLVALGDMLASDERLPNAIMIDLFRVSLDRIEGLTLPDGSAIPVDLSTRKEDSTMFGVRCVMAPEAIVDYVPLDVLRRAMNFLLTECRMDDLEKKA